MVGGADVDVEGHQAPHADAHRGDVGRPHVGVGHDDDVARQPLPLPAPAGPRSGGCRPPPRPRPGTSRSPAAGRRWPAGPAPPRAGTGPGPCRRWRPGPGTRGRRGRRPPPARTGASATRRGGRRAGRRGGRRRGRWGRRGRRGGGRRRPTGRPPVSRIATCSRPARRKQVGGELGRAADVGGVVGLGRDGRDPEPGEEVGEDPVALAVEPAGEARRHIHRTYATGVAGDVDAVRSRLESIAEELADLALDRLREAVAAGRGEDVAPRSGSSPGPAGRWRRRSSSWARSTGPGTDGDRLKASGSAVMAS